jgi:hypothetical protein
MKHLEEVKEEDSVNSSWKAQIPGGLGTVSWKATIIEDRPQELLRWASQPGSTIDNAGEVRFKDSASGNGTDIVVNMTYRLPAGDVGSLAGKLFNPVVEKMMKDDLRRFKTILETAENALPGTGGSYGTASSGIGTTSSSYTGTENPGLSDADPDLSKPKRARTRKGPEASSDTKSTRDTTLQSSPSNDINQPTQKHLQDPDRDF